MVVVEEIVKIKQLQVLHLAQVVAVLTDHLHTAHLEPEPVVKVLMGVMEITR